MDADTPLHLDEFLLLRFLYQRDDDTLGSGTGGSPTAVFVRLAILRWVVMNHTGDILDIDATGCHIGGYHGDTLAITESLHCSVAFSLG
jgi:hypothetical protein